MNNTPPPANHILLYKPCCIGDVVMTTALLSAHMVIFWLSQDSNVTPPVCLTAFTAAAIAGTKPMETGFQSWKLAKGLYIIPLLFVYTPILFEGPLWQVAETAVSALAGLFCFAAGFEGYHRSRLNWAGRAGYMAAAVMMLWPSRILHLAGAVLLVVLFLLQRKESGEQAVPAGAAAE